MKNIIFIGMVAAAGSMLAGCSGGAPKDSTAKADSTNMTKDSAEKKSPASYGQLISGVDAEFAVAAANGGMAEVELGELAKEKAVSRQVKDFGAMMVMDHSKANAELKALAAAKHIVLPTVLNTKEQKLKTELSAKSGADFDKAYINAMVDDHKTDISDFERAHKTVKYPEMKAFADKTLPVLKMHLSAVQKIKNQMK